MSFTQVKNATDFQVLGQNPATKVGFVGLSEVKESNFHDLLSKTKVGFGLSEVKDTDFHDFLSKKPSTKVGFGLSEVKEISTA